MKNKLSILIVSICTIFLSSSLIASEPDESGLGGTGHSAEPETLLELFRKPDLPERVDLPDIIVTPDIPELGASEGSSTVPSIDTSVPIGTAGGSPPQP